MNKKRHYYLYTIIKIKNRINYHTLIFFFTEKYIWVKNEWLNVETFLKITAPKNGWIRVSCILNIFLHLLLNETNFYMFAANVIYIYYIVFCYIDSQSPSKLQNQRKQFTLFKVLIFKGIKSIEAVDKSSKEETIMQVKIPIQTTL